MAQAVPIIGSALLGMGVSQAAKKMGVDPKLAALLGAAAGMGVGSMASGAGSAAASTSSGVVGAAPVYDAFGNVISSAAADASTLASAAMIDPFASSITTGIGVPEVIQPYAEYGSGMTVTPQYDAFGDVISAPEIPFQSEYMIDPFAAQPATPYDASEFMGTSFTDPTVPALSRAGEPSTFGLDQRTVDLINQDYGDVMDPLDPRLNVEASTDAAVDLNRNINITQELSEQAVQDPLYYDAFGNVISSPSADISTLESAAMIDPFAKSPFDVAVDKLGNFWDDIPDWAKQQGSSFLYNMAMQLMSSMFKKPELPIGGGGGQAFAPAFRATTVPFSGAGGGGGLGGNTLLPARQRTRFVPQGVA